MTDNTEHVSAKLTDIDRIERWNSLVADHDGAKSELVKDLIDDAYEARDLEGAPDPTDTDKEDGGYWYDPSDEIDEPLNGDDLREILWEFDSPAINPDHVMGRQIPIKSQAETADVLAAYGRFYDIDPTQNAVDGLIKRTIGKGRDRHNIHTYRDRVLDRLRDEDVVRADNVHWELVEYAHDSDEINVPQETYDEWEEKTREVMENELPVEVLEGRLEAAQVMLDGASDDHPRVDELREVVEELEGEIDARDGGE